MASESSRPIVPSSTRRRTAAAVNVLVLLEIRKGCSGVSGRTVVVGGSRSDGDVDAGGDHSQGDAGDAGRLGGDVGDQRFPRLRVVTTVSTSASVVAAPSPSSLHPAMASTAHSPAAPPRPSDRRRRMGRIVGNGAGGWCERGRARASPRRGRQRRRRHDDGCADDRLLGRGPRAGRRPRCVAARARAPGARGWARRRRPGDARDRARLGLPWPARPAGPPRATGRRGHPDSAPARCTPERPA